MASTRPLTLARRLGLGRVAYHLLYRPLSRIQQSIREGGPIEQWRTLKGQREMEAAASDLPLPTPASGEPLEVHFLTGRRYWYQTVFCLWSLARQSGRPLHPVIYDDGSLHRDFQIPITRLFPKTRFQSNDQITDRLDQHLPRHKFPVLRERRLNFALLRKLTDPHVGENGWKLVLDSDLLFFRSPTLLVNWLDAPTLPLHSTDVENAYGYPLELLTELAGHPVPERVNTGLCGLRSESIDWGQVEKWCRTLIERGGPQYYQEQALVALLLAGKERLATPLGEYVTLPQAPEISECRAIMHHYVADSKAGYFRHNWRRVLNAPHL